MLANYGAAYSFVGEKEKSDSCYKAAYEVSGNRRGYFKWSKDGTRTVTCSLVILNKKHFVFDELRNNRRVKMKRLKE